MASPILIGAEFEGGEVCGITDRGAGDLGSTLLTDAAVNAAREWQFKPVTFLGVPVNVIGKLTFYFEP
jgi:hypothetical protein